MSDRLEDIKAWYSGDPHLMDPDIRWLIAALEESRREVERLREERAVFLNACDNSEHLRLTAEQERDAAQARVRELESGRWLCRNLLCICDDCPFGVIEEF